MQIKLLITLVIILILSQSLRIPIKKSQSLNAKNLEFKVTNGVDKNSNQQNKIIIGTKDKNDQNVELRQTVQRNFKKNDNLNAQLFTQINKTLKNFDKQQQETLSLGDVLIELKLKTTFGNSYEGEVLVGSNKQPISALFDTGSSIIWFASSSCKNCIDSGMKELFQCKSSNTCVETKLSDSIKYGKGYCEGILMKDNMDVAGKVIKNQDFLGVNKVKDFPNFPGDGLIGLGSPALTHGETTLIENLYIQGLIKKKQFAMVLNPRGTSFLDIGGIDQKLFSGDIIYLPVQKETGYWSVSIHKLFMVIGKRELSITRSSNTDNWQFQAESLVIDSGTSIITFPSQDVEALLKMLKMTGHSCYYDTIKYSQIVCEFSIQEFPILGVTAQRADGRFIDVLIDPIQYVICSEEILKACIVRVSKLDIKKFAIFGDIFMQSFYTIFDVEDSQIGFAQLSNRENEFITQYSSIQMSEDVQRTQVTDHLVQIGMGKRKNSALNIQEYEREDELVSSLKFTNMSFLQQVKQKINYKLHIHDKNSKNTAILFTLCCFTFVILIFIIVYVINHVPFNRNRKNIVQSKRKYKRCEKKGVLNRQPLSEICVQLPNNSFPVAFN